jgi:hypothetical protein
MTGMGLIAGEDGRGLGARSLQERERSGKLDEPVPCCNHPLSQEAITIAWSAWAAA